MDSGETDDELCSLGSTVQPAKKNGCETNIVGIYRICQTVLKNIIQDSMCMYIYIYMYLYYIYIFIYL